MASNLTTLMVMAAQKITLKATTHFNLKYKINFAQALSKMKHQIIQLTLLIGNDCLFLIHRTIKYISRTVEAVRDGRSNPRKLKNIKNNIHFTAYKSAL